MICTFKNYNLFCVIYDKNWPLSVAGEIAQTNSSSLLSSYLTLSCRTIPLVTKTFRYYFHNIFSIGMVNTLLAIFIKNELVIHNDAFFYPVKKNNGNSFKE